MPPKQPQLTAAAWLQSEEANGASTPASPLVRGDSFNESPASRRSRGFGSPRKSPNSLKRSPNSPARSPGSPGLLPRNTGNLGDIRRAGGKRYPPVEYTPRARLLVDVNQPQGASATYATDASPPLPPQPDPLFAGQRVRQETASEGQRDYRTGLPTNTGITMPPVPARCASRVEERVKRASLSNSPSGVRNDGAQGWGSPQRASRP